MIALREKGPVGGEAVARPFEDLSGEQRHHAFEGERPGVLDLQ